MNSYYHTLGSGNSTPLDLLINLISVQELQVVSGVCSMLEAVRSADRGVGCDAVGTWNSVPGARLVSREPCTHRSGPYVETSAGLPADGT